MQLIFVKVNILLFVIVMTCGDTISLERQIFKKMKDFNLEFSFTSYEIINKNDLRIGLREAQY